MAEKTSKYCYGTVVKSTLDLELKLSVLYTSYLYFYSLLFARIPLAAYWPSFLCLLQKKIKFPSKDYASFFKIDSLISIQTMIRGYFLSFDIDKKTYWLKFLDKNVKSKSKIMEDQSNPNTSTDQVLKSVSNIADACFENNCKLY